MHQVSALQSGGAGQQWHEGAAWRVDWVRIMEGQVSRWVRRGSGLEGSACSRKG